MPVLCYETKSSIQPVCGAHHVPLVRNLIPIDPYAPGLGKISCYICPVSQAVAEEVKVSNAQR